MSEALPPPQFGPNPSLTEISNWLLQDREAAGELAFILLAALGKDVVVLPSLAALTVISDVMAVALDQRRIPKATLKANEGPIKEAQRWIEINRALQEVSHG